MHRFLRCVICLVLICAILVNVSPMRVRAVSGTVAVAARAVAVSALIGLGLSMGTDAIQYNSLVNSVVSGIQNAGVVISNGLMDVVSLGSGLLGVKSDLIKGIFDGLYANNVLKSDSAGTSYTLYNPMFSGASTYAYSSNVPFAPCWFYYNYAGQHYICEMFVALEECTITRTKISGTSSGWTTRTLSTRRNGYYIAGSTVSRANYDMTGAQGIYLGEFEQDYYDWLNKGIRDEFDYACKFLSDKFGFSSAPSTDYDLTLNFIAEPGISLATGYPAWHQNAVSIPNPQTGQDEEYLPLALGDTYEETIGMTQEDVWAGNGTLTDTDIETGTGTGSGSITVPETVTLSDILAGILSVPQAIAQAVAGFFADVVSAVRAIPAAISEAFSVKGDVGDFSISLSDYFPFCIPFDIYDFLTCLNADPVAPVIEWSIFERDGTAHPITIDLSPFDGVAQLLRTLQLLLFCVGLATKTRDLIKG